MAKEYRGKIAQYGLLAALVATPGGAAYAAGAFGGERVDSPILRQSLQEVVDYNKDGRGIEMIAAKGEGCFGAKAGGCSFGASACGKGSSGGGDKGDKK